MLLVLLVLVALSLFILYVLTLLFPDVFGNNNERMKFVMKTLHSLQLKTERRNYPVMTIKDFLHRTSKDDADQEAWCICFGHVINLKGFSRVHPGGDFLDHFIGKDMTPWMIISHSKSETALKHLRTRAVAVIENNSNNDLFDMSLLPEMDKSYVRMFFEFVEKGRFVNQHAWTIRDVLETYMPLLVGYPLALWYPSMYWVGIALLCISGSRQGIFYHDIMHRSVFSCAARARRVVYLSSMLIWGFDFNVIGDIHDIHHGFVNVIGLDTAIDMPLLPVDPAHFTVGKRGFPSLFRKYLFAANAFFYGFLAWMVLPFYSLYPFFSYYLSSWKGFLTGGLAAVIRTVLVFWFWEYHSPIIIAAVVGFFYFALIGSLNHFHKQMTTKEQFFESYRPTSGVPGEIDTFVSLQSQTVQNTDHGTIADALLGHFTLHIEHHLFPMMPRRAYNEASHDIQNLLRQYNLQYSVCSQSDAISSFNNTLRFPESKLIK